ncbi:hypothetical protein ACFQHV_11675 [Promicromonospora thailandica]|uniref:Uncharacterized protein n=1 Tax=Promicromonospora thailandica TaxID=765201 RepID=A0A9X2G0Z0_9MICO|nr:hypothetical protein [Promicromonospora thailandica]MCP2265042.1 hypothetical protein [Promicromonospora thailandica]BFF19904.1 hypothetical protein GCM10025730_34250 [Promicromonospora thailandica]
MTFLAGVIPAEHASGHILVLPSTHGPVAVSELAAAWFSEVEWLREPSRTVGSRRMAGARFRGMAQPDALVPGVLRLGEGYVATGPFEVGEASLAELEIRATAAEAYSVARGDGLRDVRGAAPTSYDDRDGIARAFPHALPQGEELRLVQWMVAAARKTGGGVLADGRQPLVPDPAGSVDLGLYSAHPLQPADVLPMLRSLIATADVTVDRPTPDGSPHYQLVGSTAYDGSIVVDVERVDRVPRALGSLDWRSYGPFAYRMSWMPADPYELELEHPSGLHVIARARMRASLARLAVSLQSRIAGILVDDGGFIADAQELEGRNDPTTGSAPGARAWV